MLRNGPEQTGKSAIKPRRMRRLRSASDSVLQHALNAARRPRASPPLGRPGLALGRQAKVSKWAQGSVLRARSGEEQRGGDRSRPSAIRRIGEIGNVAIQHLVIAVPQRHPPDRVGRPPCRGIELLGKLVVIGEQGREVGPERDPRRAGQGGEVEDQLGLVSRRPWRARRRGSAGLRRRYCRSRRSGPCAI